MGFRFRKSIKIMPGLRLNLSRSGISANVGVRGANVSVNSRGTFLNAGIPGTGVSYRERIGEIPSQADIAVDQRPSRSSIRLRVLIIIVAIAAIIAFTVSK